ncbi:MAG TPA: TIM barrel protein [Candidatus Methylacidiphilales bacterium]|jgi:sugar phosphate isomerase/epimerase|nr:TIM barrel protein [Candidatus Methylacidiphilales bacterium]
MNRPSILQRLVGSPCCLPAMEKHDLFRALQKLGLTKYEAFSVWTKCRHEATGYAAAERRLAADYGLAITSYHLPLITRQDTEGSFHAALEAGRFASRLGAGIVLLKAAEKNLFGAAGRRFLDAVEAENLKLTTVLQNHADSAISTVQDYRDVFAMLDHDPRMKAVLEVGHFRRMGVSWREGWDALGERIALIHVNEIRDKKSVLYGTGEVDFAGLMAQVKKSTYAGDIVVELELEDHAAAPEKTLEGLRHAVALLAQLYEEA